MSGEDEMAMEVLRLTAEVAMKMCEMQGTIEKQKLTIQRLRQQLIDGKQAPTGNVCKVCGQVAPLVDDECPDCMH